MTSSKPTAARIALSAISVLLVLILSGCGGLASGGGSSATTIPKDGEVPTFEDGTSMKTIQERGRLIVGITPDQAPFSSQNANTGSWEGFDVDVANQIARSIFGENIEGKVQFIPIEARDREAALGERRVDLAVGRYVITIARKRFVDFAGPYYIAKQNVIVRSRVNSNVSTTTIGNVAQLNSNKACVATRSTNIEALKALVPTATIVTKTTVAECTAALISGEVGAVAADHVDLLPYVQDLGRAYTVLPTTFGEQPYGIGVRLNNTSLRSHINNVLTDWDGWTESYTRTTGDRAEQPQVDRY